MVKLAIGILAAAFLVAGLATNNSVVAASLNFTPDDNWRSKSGTVFFGDHITGDNQFDSPNTQGEQRWTIDLGADVYAQEQYERPIIQNTDSADTSVTDPQRAYTTYFGFLDKGLSL